MNALRNLFRENFLFFFFSFFFFFFVSSSFLCVHFVFPPPLSRKAVKKVGGILPGGKPLWSLLICVLTPTQATGSQVGRSALHRTPIITWDLSACNPQPITPHPPPPQPPPSGLAPTARRCSALEKQPSLWCTPGNLMGEIIHPLASLLG